MGPPVSVLPYATSHNPAQNTLLLHLLVINLDSPERADIWSHTRGKRLVQNSVVTFFMYALAHSGTPPFPYRISPLFRRVRPPRLLTRSARSLRRDANGNGTVEEDEFISFYYHLDSGKARKGGGRTCRSKTRSRAIAGVTWLTSLRTTSIVSVLITYFQLTSSITRSFPQIEESQAQSWATVPANTLPTSADLASEIASAKPLSNPPKSVLQAAQEALTHMFVRLLHTPYTRPCTLQLP